MCSGQEQSRTVPQLTFDERFARMTPRAIAALTLAKEEARRFNHNYIGTEHLLWGLLCEGTGLGITILTNLGLDIAQLAATVEGILLQSAQPGGQEGEIGLTPRARQVINLAVEEARALNVQHVGQEHLLLGFAREGDGIAGRLLLEHGATLERLRAEVTRIQSLGRPATAATGPKNNVITCRLTDSDLQALDDLVEAGVRSTRSDAAAWLVHIGIEANSPLLETVRGTVAEIRRLREHAQSLAQQLTRSLSVAQPEPEPPAETTSA
jgi:ATP-dependent Clp protease ATP-binding subunit ClpA